MSRKNFKVATTEDGKTTITKIDKTPTGKVKTIKDKEAAKKAREEQFINMRVNALKRRAKRMKLSEEQINECVEKLKAQLTGPNEYYINILFKHGVQFSKLAKQAILNSKIPYKFLSDNWAYIEGNQDVLNKLREILAGCATIHPYVKKFESVLPKSSTTRTKKPSNNNKNVAAEAKKTRKNAKIERVKKRIPRNKTKTRKTLAKHRNTRKGITVQIKCKKRSNALKKASTGLKQAA